MQDTDTVDRFITRWSQASGSERSNCQPFVMELCALLGLPTPDPAREDTRDNAYVFERRVNFAHGDGSQSNGFIDCYRRGAFVLEAKKVKAGRAGETLTKGFDDALMRARNQAEGYARALPAAEGRPPFLLVVDVGHVLELYAEFTRSGATYTPFPDARSHRLKLQDLRDETTRQRLRLLWQDPMALDPARASAKVTREVATKLAHLARSLEDAGHAPQAVAAFLTRCLFCMFAEDVELLPKAADGRGAFVSLLQQWQDQPDTLRQMLRVLWMDMDRGGFSAAVHHPLLRFNGKLFKGNAADDFVLPLQRTHIEGLLDAARSNWREVEPAIFGTLLERALDTDERHALGAHYTPRAYVERLVLPTVVEPLRADWADAQAAALVLAKEADALDGKADAKRREDKLAEARAEIKRFHHQLCTTRVLDPACGSGNFLYVTLEHMKRLEGEVHNQLEALGEVQTRLGFEGETVTPQQLLGIEINERAAALAELVLWIGYLQWHIRSFGNASVAEPVVHDYGNIEHRDAVLAYDGMEPMRDAAGQLVQRWDGKTYRRHPVTGENVPDETALVPQWRYLNPRPAAWPAAEFIVGNPPFIGNKRMRDALGDGYVEALKSAGIRDLGAADFVMHWWAKAAAAVQAGQVRRSGLISTNSITQSSNRKVVSQSLERGTALVFAIPDHPWVDSANGAAVRISMSVLGNSTMPGRLASVIAESEGSEGEAGVTLANRVGAIGPSFRIGAAPSQSLALEANRGLSFMGVILCGDGFLVSEDAASTVRSAARSAGVLSNYLSGTDLARSTRGHTVIDFSGLSEEEARLRCPPAYQWIRDRVWPERQLNRMRRRQQEWWLYGSSAPRMRQALRGLVRYIATARTAKFRVFQFVSGDALVESNVVAVASADSAVLGVLSTVVHVAWAAATGATLEDRPHYTNSTVFEPFPFPSDDTGLTPDLTTRIRTLAEQLDAHRKAQQAAHPDLTLTGMYNVLEKLRTGEALTPKDKLIHTQGLVSVLKSLHDDLDAAVLAAYGWQDLQAALADHTQAESRAAAVETLLERLVALNAKRAAEEAAGHVRWLRPDFQQRGSGVQAGMDVTPDVESGVPEPAAPAPAVPKRPWPSGLPEQIKAVADTLAASPAALSLADIEARFTARGRWRERLPTILDTLEALGRARRPRAGAAVWQGA